MIQNLGFCELFFQTRPMCTASTLCIGMNGDTWPHCGRAVGVWIGERRLGREVLRTKDVPCERTRERDRERNRLPVDDPHYWISFWPSRSKGLEIEAGVSRCANKVPGAHV